MVVVVAALFENAFQKSQNKKFSYFFEHISFFNTIAIKKKNSNFNVRIYLYILKREEMGEQNKIHIYIHYLNLFSLLFLFALTLISRFATKKNLKSKERANECCTKK